MEGFLLWWSRCHGYLIFWLEVFWLMTAMGTNKLVERGDKTEIFNVMWFYELGLSPAGLD